MVIILAAVGVVILLTSLIGIGLVSVCLKQQRQRNSKFHCYLLCVLPYNSVV